MSHHHDCAHAQSSALEAKRHSSIASNIILVPACTKNYVLPLTSMTLTQYYGPKVPFYIFFSYLYAELGTQLNGLRDLDVERSFTKLSLAQKIQSFLGIILVVVSIAIAVVLTIKFKRQLAAMERKGKVEVWIREYD